MGATLILAQSGVDWIEPLSALSGALIGGLISYLTTRMFEKGRLKEVRQGLAYAVVFKLVRLTNDLEQTQQHLTNCLGPLDEIVPNESLWQKLLDFFGFSDAEIVFSAEELALVASMKNQQLTMNLMELEAGHRIVTSTIRQMAVLRQKIADSGLATQINGNIVTFEGTKEQIASIGPTLINLNSFARSLIGNFPDLTSLGKETSTSLSSAFNTHYKFKNFVHLSYPVDVNKNPVVETQL
jgi:hypothetical protein